MAKRTVFRTDACDFSNGQILTPRGDHLATLHPTNHSAERLIRAGRADGHDIRSRCIYVWENARVGEMNWSREKTKHLYELVICESDILHRADVDWFSAVAGAAENHELAAAAVCAYWNGPIKSDRVELLVRKATVVNKLKDKIRSS
jgi:hypothetical protein